MSPTQRSLQKLRREGYLVAIVEHWNSFIKRRQDLFGFADLLAVRGDTALLVQTTSGCNVAARIGKISQSSAAKLWLGSTTRKIVVHGWAKRGAAGAKKEWTCREVEMAAADLGPVVPVIQAKRKQKPLSNLELFKKNCFTNADQPALLT